MPALPRARPEIVFLINLLQDVNILRGLVYLARRETDAHLRFLVSANFLKRDKQQIWQREVSAIAAEIGADIHVFGELAQAQAVLQGKGGLLIAASESNLSAHWETHGAFAVAPPSFVKITLQHGLECVGFLQSREHVIGHGRDIHFGADIVCSWFAPDRLTATPVAERSKIVFTGPPTLLQRPRRHPDHPPIDGGIVCENMHSVRLRASGDHKASFMDIFFAFCERMAQQGKDVTLRPHPGGQYVIKNNIALPDNVPLNNLPIYDVALGQYQFGISAPSTVVFDMVLAGIPVGVWRDPGGIMDAGNYDGLTEIGRLEDWLEFEQASRAQPDAILARQAAYLEKKGIPTNPEEIYMRFARLFQNALALHKPARPAGQAAADPVLPRTKPAKPVKRAMPKRVMFVANSLIATLQLSFLKPLAGHFADGLEHEILTEAEITERFRDKRHDTAAAQWVDARLRAFKPDLVVCSRYSGPHATQILDTARAIGAPVIYHIDDDLLNVPRELGEAKWRMHNDPKRLHSVRSLLTRSTLVYASTPVLKHRLRQHGVAGAIFVGAVYCTSRILRVAEAGPVRRVGYMGTSSHVQDFNIAVPAITRYLDANPEVTFELFGLKPIPDPLLRFGERVQSVPTVDSYTAFLQALAARKWDIGLCPLAHTPFNAVKANTKWVEYTACGMAVVATKGLVYDRCAADGRGILVTGAEWDTALQRLTDDPGLRYRMAIQAQAHLLTDYSEERLRLQVLDAFAEAMALAEGGAATKASDPIRGQPVTPDAKGLIPLPA